MLRTKLLLWGQGLIKKGAWYFAPLSAFYALAVFIRNRLYDWGWKKGVKVKPVVVSVGNIVAGGSGKTPFVHLLAKQFAHRRVAILSRGYGQIPDEAILLARKLPGVRVLVGKDRAELAKQIDVDLILLDDGFQHRKLHRDVEIVLGEIEGHYLPWGFLRDSPRRIKKVDVHFCQQLKLRVNRIVSLKGEVIPSIQGWKVSLFSGIAHPENFKKTVLSLGAEIESEWVFADHEQADLSLLPQQGILLCTEKDFVKLPPTQLSIYYLEMEMEFVGEREEWEKLIEKIDQKIDNQPHL